MDFLPGGRTAVDAGGKAPNIPEVRGLIHIAAFPHNAVRQCVEEQAVRIAFQPFYKLGEHPAPKILVPVHFREKAHLTYFHIVAGLEPVAGEYLPYALERLGSPAQRHHARKPVSSVKAQIVLIQPGHDFGIMVAVDKADGPLFGDFPHRELRAMLARSGVIPVLAHSSYPPGGLS